MTLKYTLIEQSENELAQLHPIGSDTIYYELCIFTHTATGVCK